MASDVRADAVTGVTVVTAAGRVRVWLDDRRPAPSGWYWCRTPAEAIALIETGGVEEVSLDHDLGLLDGDGREQTGYDVLVWIEEQLVVDGMVPPSLAVHSANAPAHERMQRAIDSINARLRR